MPRASDATVLVRPARDEDRPALRALNAALQAVERALRPSRCAPEALPGRVLEEMLTRARGGVLVAVEGEAVVGFLAWRIDEDLLETEPKGLVVTDLVVAETHRGRGLGGRLLEAAEARAREAGAARLRVTALVSNEAAISAYVARGFASAFVTFEKPLTDQGGA